MTNKIILIIIVVLLLVLGWYIYKSKKTETQELPAVIEHTQIVYKQVPAKVETLVVNNVPREYATYEAEKDTNNVHLSLKIGYDELDNKFDVKADIFSKEKVLEPKKVQFSSSIGIGFKPDDIDPDYAVLDAGVKVKNYRITAFADTRKTIGVRLGVDF